MHGAADQGATPPAAAVRSARALLGVTGDAELPELTRAYWRQARRLHPDLSSDPEATQQFQALHAAYRLALGAALAPPPTSPMPSDRPPAQSRPTRTSRTTKVDRDRSGHDRTTRRQSSPAPGATTSNTSTPAAGSATFVAASAGPDDGVWVVAGPVHVQPPRDLDPARSFRKGRR